MLPFVFCVLCFVFCVFPCLYASVRALGLHRIFWSFCAWVCVSGILSVSVSVSVSLCSCFRRCTDVSAYPACHCMSQAGKMLAQVTAPSPCPKRLRVSRHAKCACELHLISCGCLQCQFSLTEAGCLLCLPVELRNLPSTACLPPVAPK